MNARQEDIEKLKRYVESHTAGIEKQEIEHLFLNGENDFLLRQTLEKDWYKMEGTPSDKNIDHILDRIHHTIRTNESACEQKPVRRLLRLYSRIAAVLLLPLLASGLLYYFLSRADIASNSDFAATIYAPMGARVKFNLPDGTSGYLNGGSELRYSANFLNNRQIWFKGEAWLDVKHDKKHPFEIKTENSKIRVLGTSFNLSTYPNEKFVEVVLKEGKVEFIDDKTNHKVIMAPSERLISQNGEIKKQVVDPEKYSAWTEGKLIFRSDSMAEVARRIERWYNVKVTLVGKDIEKYKFRATFQDDKLEDVLKFLSMTSPISYRIIPRRILPNGSYTKEEVTIFNIN